MSAISDEYGGIQPRYFYIEHALRRRIRVRAPSLRKDAERIYALEILLRKRPSIRRVRSVPHLGTLVIDFDPAHLSLPSLIRLLDAVIPGLGHGNAGSDSPAEMGRTTCDVREINFAIEGMTCSSCALLIELRLRRDPRVHQVSVNMATETASLLGVIPEDEVHAIVRGLGYQVQPVDTLLQRKLLMEREELRVQEARRRAIIAGVLGIPVTVIAMAMWQGRFWRWSQFLLSTPVVLWAGRPFFDKAVRLARHGSANMDTQIALGVGSAYVFSTVGLLTGAPHLYFDAASGILGFVLLGRYLEERAKGRAHAAIRRLLDMQPHTAQLLRDGEIVTVSVDDLQPDDLILIRPGDRMPADGVVVEGLSRVDESMVTGESLPVVKAVGHTVVAGCINGNGALRVRVTAIGADTVLAGIIHMVDQAQSSRLPIQKTVDRICAVFVPGVILISGATFAGWLLAGAGLTTAFTNGIAVLLIACPCALGLATPAAIMVGTGQAAERGIYIRNGESLELATRLDTIIFDKTGTLTVGKPEVTDFRNVSGFEDYEILSLAAAAEAGSEHFLAQAILSYAREQGAAEVAAETFESLPGRGIRARVKARDLIIGAQAWLAESAVDMTPLSDPVRNLAGQGKTPVIMAVDGRVAALFGIADHPRAGAAEAVARLGQLGVEAVMVTGDAEATARHIADRVGIRTVIAQARPERKLEIVQEYQRRGARVGMIGDGINDAPALAAADVGFAIGTGTDVAIETADLTLANGDIAKVAEAMELSGKTLGIIRQNLFWALGYNTLAIPVAAAGKLNPMIACMAMAFSSVSVVLNSLRLQRGPSPGVRSGAPDDTTV
ncbi:MAG: heavy metal translocating P-type ATPase [Methylococcus sp.]